jgi:hypothetical protein
LKHCRVQASLGSIVSVVHLIHHNWRDISCLFCSAGIESFRGPILMISRRFNGRTQGTTTTRTSASFESIAIFEDECPC